MCFANRMYPGKKGEIKNKGVTYGYSRYPVECLIAQRTH